jgi:O-antigen biosynthesis protein
MPFRRIASLFRRYAAAHLSVTVPGQPLWDEAGQMVGQIDRLRFGQGRIVAEGWTTAQAVTLRQGMARVERAPSHARPDVERAHPQLRHKTPGFSLDLPAMPGLAVLGLSFADQRLIYPLPLPPKAQLALAHAALLPAFLRDMTRAAPALIRCMLGRDPACRTHVKRHLGLDVAAPAQGLQHLLFLDDSLAAMPESARVAELGRLVPADLARRHITIVMPIHNAFDLLPEVLDRIRRHTDLPWHLVLIEDASTDLRLRPWLRTWVAEQDATAPDRITLIENAANVGFIQSVNAGLAIAAARGDDAVLLNSDAFMPDRWASRLMRPFLIHDSVATVTPMSSDAEILTVPLACRRTPMRPGEADALDRIAAQFHPDAALADSPTGVGFCMAIGKDWLARLPSLDPVFGRGYGEEVDWCRKVRAMGGRHLATGGLFVEHRGGTSFGSAEKQRLVARNNAVISARHPGFDAEVQGFLQADPLMTPRLTLGIAFAAMRARGRIPVYLAHSLGGGAEDYLAARLALDLSQDGAGAAIVLRVGGPLRWQVELVLPDGVLRGATCEFGFVQRLLQPLTARDIIYSCGVGDTDPAGLPDCLLALKRDPGDRIEVLFHDFFPISPSYTLTDSDGHHRGLPDPTDPDSAHCPTDRSLAMWQRAWGRLITEADAVTVFSRDSHRLVLGAFPEAGRVIRLRPHRMLAEVPRCTPGRGPRPVIGVLGNIGSPKGAAVLAALSRRLAEEQTADLVLVGNLDPAFTLAPGARLHGSYRREDIPALVAHYGIDRWLIPSVWPETFSYTTHEALATGLPVWCFDLGAQAEAVRIAAHATGLGGTIPLQGGVPDIDALVARLVASAPADAEPVPA